MIMEARTELINGAGQVWPPRRGRRQGMIKISNTVRQVGAVDLECNRHLGKRRPRVRNLGSQRRHPSHLGRQQSVHGQPLASLDVISDRPPSPVSRT